MKHTINSLEETSQFVAAILPKISGGDILLLQGNLGSGKTTFTQILGKLLGINEEITSPTFAIMNIYKLPIPIQGIKQLIHVDAYRMESEEEVYDIGLDEYMNNPDTLLCIEWPERIEKSLQYKKTKRYRFELLENGARQIITD